jgi:hypothetical protein
MSNGAHEQPREGDTPSTLLSYSVPEPATYSGRNFIALGIEPEWFVAAGLRKSAPGQTDGGN